MYVISKKDTDYLTNGERYEIVDADCYEYQIEYNSGLMWIGKDDTSNFEYHV